MSTQIKYAIARLVGEKLPEVCKELSAQYSTAEKALMDRDGTKGLSTDIVVHESDGPHGYRITVREI